MEIADLWRKIHFLEEAEKLLTWDEFSKGELRASEEAREEAHKADGFRPLMSTLSGFRG